MSGDTEKLRKQTQECRKQKHGGRGEMRDQPGQSRSEKIRIRERDQTIKRYLTSQDYEELKSRG